MGERAPRASGIEGQWGLCAEAPQDWGTSAFSLLSQCSTPKEMWLAIIDQYKKWFPKGAVKYTDFNGIDRRISVGQWMSIIFDCLYMKRSFNDQTKLVNVLRNVGAI